MTVKRIREFKEYEYDVLLQIDSNPEILRTASIPFTQQQWQTCNVKMVSLI